MAIELLNLVLLTHAPFGAVITDPAQRAMWHLAQVAAQNGAPVHPVPLRPEAHDERITSLPLDGQVCLLGGYWTGRDAYAALQDNVEHAGGQLLHSVDV